MAQQNSTIHKRTCHICEANCGLLIELQDREVLSIKGNPDHVLSRGHICPKATAIADLQDDPDRLRKPVKKVDGDWQEIEWEQAYREIAEKTAALRSEGARAAMYSGNPSAHDYSMGMQTRLLHKSIDARGMFTASTLDQIPHHYAQYHLFGHVSLAAVPDIDHTQCLVIVGGNPAASNGSLWTVPDFKKRVKEMQARGGELITIDPRLSETAKLADQHHYIRPGSDTAMLIAVLKFILEKAPVPRAGLAELLDDSWKALEPALDAFTMEELSGHCGIAEDELRSLAGKLCGAKAVIYGRMGVSVCAFGSLNQWLINIINLASGNLDREGGAMFPEPLLDTVNQVGKGSIRTVETARGTMPMVMGEIPTIAFADEMLREDDERIRALFVIAGNPVVSAPDGRRTDTALAQLDLMVAVDMYVSETARHADYILPPCGPLQKDHYGLFFGPLAIRNYGDYSPAILDKEEGEKADWEIIAELASAITTQRGGKAPNIREPRDTLDAMLRASPKGMSLAEVEEHGDGVDLGALRPNLKERIMTENGLIHAVPDTLLAEIERFREVLNDASTDDRLLLIGRRHVRSNNSWLHNSQRLLKGPDRCTAMIHPDDAQVHDVSDGDMVQVASRVGAVKIPAEITDQVMAGVISIPHGFGHDREGVRLSVAAQKPGVSLNDLTDPAHYDPLTGNAVLNGTPVTLERAS